MAWTSRFMSNILIGSKDLFILILSKSMSADARPVLEKNKRETSAYSFHECYFAFLTLLIAIPAGVISACKQNSFWDRLVTVLVFFGFAMPSFWFALLLMLWFGIDLQIFPISGLTSMEYPHLSIWGKFCDLSAHLALPIIVYTVGSLAAMSAICVAACLKSCARIIFLQRKQKDCPHFISSDITPCEMPFLPLITLLGLAVPVNRGSVIMNQFLHCPVWAAFLFRSNGQRLYNDNGQPGAWRRLDFGRQSSGRFLLRPGRSANTNHG